MNQPPEYNIWYLVHNPKQLLQSVGDEYKVDVSYFYGFVYVDHEAGITINVESFCEVASDGTIKITTGPKDDDSRLMMRDPFARCKLTPLAPEQIKYLDLPDKPDWLSNYTNDEWDSLRKIEYIHPLRAPGFPDDIRFVLMPTEKAPQLEEVWGRIESQIEDDMFACTLLNQPNQDFGFSAGDHVAVQIREVEEGISSVCIGVFEE